MEYVNSIVFDNHNEKSLIDGFKNYLNSHIDIDIVENKGENETKLTSMENLENLFEDYVAYAVEEGYKYFAMLCSMADGDMQKIHEIIERGDAFALNNVYDYNDDEGVKAYLYCGELNGLSMGFEIWDKDGKVKVCKAVFVDAWDCEVFCDLDKSGNFTMKKY